MIRFHFKKFALYWNTTIAKPERAENIISDDFLL